MLTARKEFKYLLNAAQTFALQRYLGMFATSKQVYPVSSLYFDTPDFEYFRQKVEGELVHEKIRARKYSENFYDSSDVWIEKKVRVNEQTNKIRIPKKWTDFYVEGTPTLQCEHVSFSNLGLKPHVPTALVTCRRSAFEMDSGHGAWRVTFDSQLGAQRGCHPNPCGSKLNPTLDKQESPNKKRNILLLDPTQTIMEVKFVEQDLPKAMAAILARFDVRRIRFSKYAVALEALRSNRFF